MSSSEHHQEKSTDKDAAVLLNRMDNAGFERDRRSQLEMGEVPPTATSVSVPVTTAAANGNNVMGCTEQCLSLHMQHQKDLQQYQKSTPRESESPWHRLKTIFLVTTIAFLVVWIVVYTVLSQMDVV